MTKRIIITVALIAFTILAQATPFITRWDLSQPGSGANQISFGVGTNGTVSYTWTTVPAGSSGSGVVNGSTATITTLPTNAIIKLTIDIVNFNQFKIGATDNQRLVDVEQWGTINWSTMNNSFKNCFNLNISATDIPNLNNVTDMSFMFESCYVLNGPSNINSWDVSHVTNMVYMFAGAISFNQPISNWNTSNVTDMDAMFEKANSFNQPIGNWITSNVTDMRFMFENANSFNQPIGNWITINVTDMSYMFAAANSFNQPIGNWITINVTDMSYMFEAASSFNQPICNWNTSNVTNMDDMFEKANSFNQPIGNWNTSNVTDMSYMFSATFFNQPIGNWNTSNVKNMSYMFENDSMFNQSIGNWNTSNVTDMHFMFLGATSFNQPIGNWNTGNVIDMSNMFGEDTMFNQQIGNWNTSKVKVMFGMFLGATSFNQPIGNWNTSNVTDMRYMFYFAYSFNQPIGNWNTSNVTDMSYMFYFAYSFNQPIGNWNTSKVTDISYMFSDATSFNQPLSIWNLSSLLNADSLLNYSGLDCSNYSSTLNGWANNSLTPNSLILGATNIQYGSNAIADRNTLINTKGWTINGDIATTSTCFPLSISQVTNQNTQSTFYPNPATNSTSIDLYTNNNETATIKVYNTLGKLVYESKLTTHANKTTYTLPTNQLASGVYMVSIVMGSETLHKKIKIE